MERGHLGQASHSVRVHAVLEWEQEGDYATILRKYISFANISRSMLCTYVTCSSNMDCWTDKFVSCIILYPIYLPKCLKWSHMKATLFFMCEGGGVCVCIVRMSLYHKAKRYECKGCILNDVTKIPPWWCSLFLHCAIGDNMLRGVCHLKVRELFNL